jgi:signal transduction histidine kinase
MAEIVSVTEDQPTSGSPRPRPSRRLGLSGKLLLLTVPLVMIAGLMIYVPAIANFRMNRLNDRLAAANTAALVLDAAPSGMVPDSLARKILNSIGAHAVAIKMGQQRRLLAIDDLPASIDHDIDIRTMTAWSAIVDSIETMLETGNQTIRIIGPAPGRAQFIETVVDEAPLRASMYRFSRNLLLVSTGIAMLTAGLVYIALHFLFVRPMRRLTANLVGFHENPESSARIIVPSQRGDEIGVAERELSDMQRDLVSMLHQKSRLAALGLAVSKINHDLRNLLASSQLLSDQLASVPDPRVQRFAPKLMRSLERAIAFCQSTLSYGRAQEAAPDRRMILVDPVVIEVRESAGLASDASIAWISAIERGLTIDADPDHLFRVLLNLVRNAAQALEGRPRSDAATQQIRITGRREGAVAIVEVSDTGPGVPAKARDHLFEAFQSSGRPGGSGLGLTIAAELVRAHGGDIHLVEGTIGATFRITIPDRPVELMSVRSERARA